MDFVFFMDWIIFIITCGLITISFLLFVFIPLVLFTERYRVQRRRQKTYCTSVAFFHPYCNAGGGGERVLWCAIEALQNQFRYHKPPLKILVYTGDIDASPEEILQKAYQRFNIYLSKIEFIYLHKRFWVEASRYPHFTLLGQSLGSIVLGYEALNAFIPDIYIDTMGYAFTLPLFSFLAGCQTVSYVHYPTISTDMMDVVSFRQKTHNNRDYIARSPALSMGKLTYYHIFAQMYGFVGRFSNVVIVNSSWTEEHINQLWQTTTPVFKIYPPCDIKELQSIPRLKHKTPKLKILSIAQFRKEKNHSLQLKTMYQLRQIVPDDTWDMVELVIIGSTRNKEDEEWLKDMMDLAKHYSIENNVSFKTNISYSELKKEYEEALVGIHTMWNEHFGIGIVECMAAGLIMVAHRSGGPMLDIIEESEALRTGFLAATEEEYARCIAVILLLSEENRNKIREAARSSVNRFSTEKFELNFMRTVDHLFKTYEGK